MVRYKPPSSHVSSVAAVIGCLACILPGNAQWTFVDLHPDGAQQSSLSCVRYGYQTGSAQFAGQWQAGRWQGSAASWQNMHPPGALSSGLGGAYGNEQAGAINLAGGQDSRAGVWFGTAGSFTDLHPVGPERSIANDTYMGQQAGYTWTQGVARAAVWYGTAKSWIDINPPGATHSQAISLLDGRQAGWAYFGVTHAGLWEGTSSSWVDLHPAQAFQSMAFDLSETQQVGRVTIDGFRAALWSGSAGSFVDLGGTQFTGSEAYGVHEGVQVGVARVAPSLGRAALWYGTANSYVDLGAFVPEQSSGSSAIDTWVDGDRVYVGGYVFDKSFTAHAVLWTSRTVQLVSFSMFRGSVFSGNLASLQNSDDNRLVMRPGITLGTSQPPIQIILNATAPTLSPNGFSFSVESSASFGNAQQKISLYNFNTGLYEELDARLAKTTDDTVSVMVRTNPSRFIEAGTLAIRGLVSFRAVGPSLSFPWSGRIDKVWWNFPG